MTDLIVLGGVEWTEDLFTSDWLCRLGRCDCGAAEQGHAPDCAYMFAMDDARERWGELMWEIGEESEPAPSPPSCDVTLEDGAPGRVGRVWPGRSVGYRESRPGWLVLRKIRRGEWCTAAIPLQPTKIRGWATCRAQEKDWNPPEAPDAWGTLTAENRSEVEGVCDWFVDLGTGKERP